MKLRKTTTTSKTGNPAKRWHEKLAFLNNFTKILMKKFGKLVYSKAQKVRLAMVLGLFLMLSAELVTLFQPFVSQQAYALGAARQLLIPVNQQMANFLQYDQTEQAYQFNKGYVEPNADTVETNSSQIKATAYQDLSQGLTVVDPVTT